MYPKYKTFNFPGALPGSRTLLTGIRETGREQEYIITGFYEFPDNTFPTISFVFRGLLNGYGKFFQLNFPSNPNMPVISTNLYGPSVTYDKNGNELYNVVGNYTKVNAQGPFGTLYHGALDGTGKWFTLLPTTLTSEPIIGTIAHSTMGSLVVGNYDTVTVQGKAFIYDFCNNTYYDIVKPDAISITAYGIWQNSKNHYTIAGGYFNVPGAEGAYLVDWDNKKKKFSNWTNFHFDNNPVRSVITHFDGISSINGGSKYTLTGDYVSVNDPQPKAFFAIVKRINCGFLHKAKWNIIEYPGSNATSGNSVSKDIVIGVYTLPKSTTVNGYISYV